MFGYIIANSPELKVKEFETYRSYYCGLCKRLKKCYGIRGQMTLSYDMTFFVLLHTGLYEPKSRASKQRCMLHPLRKQTCLDNEYTDYAADMNILLTYYKLVDDWKDEKNKVRFAGSFLLKSKFKKVLKRYPKKCRHIIAALHKISECEKNHDEDLEKAAGYFGDIFGELFVYKQDIWEPTLRRMGFYFGKFIYLMDAYEDLEKDRKSGNYNPLLFIAEREDYEDICKTILTMMMAECAREFEKLPILRNVTLLRNIIYSGVWTRYELIQRKRRESNP